MSDTTAAEESKFLVWGRCKLGTARVYWVISAPRYGGTSWGKILDEGYEATIGGAETALQAALARRGEEGWDTSGRARAGIAQQVHRDKCIDRRKERPAKGSDTRVREYVYHHFWGGDNRAWEGAHLVLKKTKKKVFITSRSILTRDIGTEKEERWFCSEWVERERAIVLDRAALERGETTSTREKRYYSFCLDPARHDLDARGDGTAPPVHKRHLEQLGIGWPCTAEELRAAYRRRSLETHPDSGGTPEAFRMVKDAYEGLTPFVMQL